MSGFAWVRGKAWALAGGAVYCWAFATMPIACADATRGAEANGGAGAGAAAGTGGNDPAGTCLIGGLTIDAGTLRADFPCQVCDPAADRTGWTVLSDSPCDDEDACTTKDVCDNGTCIGGDAVVCEDAGVCHAAGTCDPATGQCSEAVPTEGEECEDGDVCTVADGCSSEGVCVGEPRDVTNDVEHCGACGRKCFEWSDCADGRCASLLVASFPGGSLVPHAPLAVHPADGYAYVGTGDRIMAARKDGTGSHLTMGGAENQPYAIARSGSVVAWSNYHAPSGPQGNARSSLPADPNVTSPAVTLLGECGASVNGVGVAVNTTKVFWACRPDVGAGGFIGFRLIGGQLSETIDDIMGGIGGSLVANDETVFWFRIDGAIMRAGVASEVVTPFQTGQGPPLAHGQYLALHGDHLYWSTDASDLNGDMPAIVRRRTDLSEPAQVLLKLGALATSLAVDDQAVYLLHADGGIYWIPNDGALHDPPRLLVTPEHPAKRIAIDDEAVFWTEWNAASNTVALRKVSRIPAPPPIEGSGGGTPD